MEMSKPAYAALVAHRFKILYLAKMPFKPKQRMQCSGATKFGLYKEVLQFRNVFFGVDGVF